MYFCSIYICIYIYICVYIYMYLYTSNPKHAGAGGAVRGDPPPSTFPSLPLSPLPSPRPPAPVLPLPPLPSPCWLTR